MSNFTNDEFNEFRWLIETGLSENEFVQLICQAEMPKFVEKIGKDKCDAMYEVLAKEYMEKTK